MESEYARNYHILLINEHALSILERDFSDETKEIALEVAVRELGQIAPLPNHLQAENVPPLRG